MPILPLSFHYCGVYFQSLCKKPRLKKGQVRRAYAAGRGDNLYGSQDSLADTESTTSTFTEVSTENSIASTDASVISTDTSGISSEGDNSKSTEKGSNSGLTEKGDLSTEKKSEKESNGETEEKKLDSETDQSLSDEAKKRDLSTNEMLAAMEQKQRDTHKRNLSKAKIFVIILVITNIPMAMYFSLIHQRGTILVMKHIYDASQEKNIDVLYLMPCHSTPYYR